MGKVIITDDFCQAFESLSDFRYIKWRVGSGTALRDIMGTFNPMTGALDAGSNAQYRACQGATLASWLVLPFLFLAPQWELHSVNGGAEQAVQPFG
jgi:hypothetical protein